VGILAPIVEQSQPAYLDEGFDSGGVEGATWRIKLGVLRDEAGDPIDLTGITGDSFCKVYDGFEGSLVATFTVTGHVGGQFTLELDEATTAGLAGAAEVSGRECVWECVLDDGTDEAQMWMTSNSPFTIYQGE